MGIVASVHGKAAEGAIAQVDMNAREMALEMLGQAGLAERLELRFACRGLPKKDLLSKSDPMVVVYQSAATGQTQWTETGRTDAVANTADPVFVRPVVARYTAGAPQPVRLVVYDVDKPTTTAKQTQRLSLTSQDYIGEVELMLADVMSAPGQTLELPLVDVVGGRNLPPGTVIVVKAEQMAPQDNRVVRMAFSAQALAKKDTLTESDPFLRGLKLRKVGGKDVEDWMPVFKTEVRDNNPDPVWMPIEVDIRQLCGADAQCPLKLQVFDYDSNGSHQLIGECQTSLAALEALAGAGPVTAPRALELIAPPGSSNGGKPGTLLVRQIQVRAGATPTQLLAGCLPSCLSG